MRGGPADRARLPQGRARRPGEEADDHVPSEGRTVRTQEGQAAHVPHRHGGREPDLLPDPLQPLAGLPAPDGSERQVPVRVLPGLPGHRDSRVRDPHRRPSEAPPLSWHPGRPDHAPADHVGITDRVDRRILHLRVHLHVPAIHVRRAVLDTGLRGKNQHPDHPQLDDLQDHRLPGAGTQRPAPETDKTHHPDSGLLRDRDVPLHPPRPALHAQFLKGKEGIIRGCERFNYTVLLPQL